MSSKWRSVNNGKSGFTLIELIVAMLITSIVGGLILDNFVRGLSQAKEDRDKVATTISLTGVLERIGSDIRSAGEGVPDDSFPAISFDDNAKTVTYKSMDGWSDVMSDTTITETNRVVIRRAILQPLTLCRQVDSGTNIAETDATRFSRTIKMVVATDDPAIDNPGCRTSPLQTDATITPVLPQSLRDIRNYRCKFAKTLNPDTPDGCHTATSLNNSYPIVSALLWDKNGYYHTFAAYDEEVKPIASGNEFALLIDAGASPEGANAIVDYPVGSSIYVIEKREYALDDRGNINLYVNDVLISTVASNVEKFRVSAKLYADRAKKTMQSSPTNPCPVVTSSACFFNTSVGDRWKDIASIKIELQRKYDPLGKGTTPSSADIDKLSAVSEFSLPNNKD
jgi:prepilin-type N-terminal cleavage/methylation domain-containing protein